MAQQFCTTCGNLLREGSKFCNVCGTQVRNKLNLQKQVETIEVSRARSAIATNRKPMSRQAKFIYGGIIVGIIIIFFSVFTSYISDSPHPVIERQQTVAMQSMYTDQTIQQFPIPSRIENGKILIPLATLLEKRMVEFDYDATTTVVPLLAYISNEGKLVTAIRFCEPCNSKNFRAEGRELVCGNCGTRWNLNNLRGVSGTCQKFAPAPIPSQVLGNEVQIEEKVVASWKLRI